MNLQQLFSKLEINESDSLIELSDKDWKKKVNFPSRVIRLLEDTKKWSPKAIFCFDNKPLILFFENPENKEELHKAVWNFNESPIVIISENDIVSVYNGFAIDENTKLLKELGGDEILNDLNYFELVTGKTFEKFIKDFNYLHRVDYRLLKNIEDTQDELLNKHDCDRKTANALLGKIIFIRYLIDRKVKINFDGISREWTNQEFCDLLLDKARVYRFFDYLQDKDSGFNGDLFPIEKDSFDDIPNEAFELIKSLLEGGEIKTGQQSLFQLYDFSVLPIEFISNVYERFIGKENQAKAGAYYTPTFLVDYIISQTVAKKLNTDNSTVSCKVLDPACGSGIFLVESLRKIIEKYIALHGISDDKQAFKEVIKRLAQENIFGIDKDDSAVQVAIFSVYLTLLDYQKPAEIENFKFPTLLNTNFFVADFFETEVKDKTKADFNKELKKHSFDFILGNPPWFRGKGENETPLYVSYINNREKNERLKEQPPCSIGGKEIAQAFLIRSSDFSDIITENALIVTSKTLYNLNSVDFRTYFLHNFKVKRIFELAPVRREVFEKSNKKAIAPACVLFYKYDKKHDTDNNIIEHITLKPSRFFSLFKVFSINRTDFKKVQQTRLKEYDWLWKTLVYGSYLDFNFIKRLNVEFSSIKDVLDENEILFKQGLKRVDDDKKIDVTEIVGKPFLNTQKRHLRPFRIFETSEEWEENEVGYIFKQNGKPYIELFKPFSLLIAGGIFKDLTSNAAINKEERVFTSSVRALKINDENQLGILYNINTILCSSLFSYYMLNVGASAAIEREESEDEEIEKMWYLKIQDVIAKAQKIEQYQKDEHTLKNQAIKEIPIRQQCDEIVIPSLSLTVEEKELLNYANEFTIPIQMRHKGFEKLFFPFEYEDKVVLEDYAQLFLNRFQSNLSDKSRKFIVEIWHTSQIIGMFFKVIPVSEYSDDIVWESKQNESAIIKFITKLGAKKITDQLFVQKDVRGFEKDYFYIFKPNEKRLWHKAIGYIDVNEFADAILKAGRDSK